MQQAQNILEMYPNIYHMLTCMKLFVQSLLKYK